MGAPRGYSAIEHGSDQAGPWIFHWRTAESRRFEHWQGLTRCRNRHELRLQSSDKIIKRLASVVITSRKAYRVLRRSKQAQACQRTERHLRKAQDFSYARGRHKPFALGQRFSKCGLGYKQRRLFGSSRSLGVRASILRYTCKGLTGYTELFRGPLHREEVIPEQVLLTPHHRQSGRCSGHVVFQSGTRQFPKFGLDMRVQPQSDQRSQLLFDPEVSGSLCGACPKPVSQDMEARRPIKDSPARNRKDFGRKTHILGAGCRTREEGCLSGRIGGKRACKRNHELKQRATFKTAKTIWKPGTEISANFGIGVDKPRHEVERRDVVDRHERLKVIAKVHAATRETFLISSCAMFAVS